MPLQFEWDTQKAQNNVATHGVSFEEASTAFQDTMSVTIPDHLHSEGEGFVLLGYSH